MILYASELQMNKWREQTEPVAYSLVTEVKQQSGDSKSTSRKALFPATKHRLDTVQ